MLPVPTGSIVAIVLAVAAVLLVFWHRRRRRPHVQAGMCRRTGADRRRNKLPAFHPDTERRRGPRRAADSRPELAELPHAEAAAAEAAARCSGGLVFRLACGGRLLLPNPVYQPPADDGREPPELHPYGPPDGLAEMLAMIGQPGGPMLFQLAGGDAGRRKPRTPPVPTPAAVAAMFDEHMEREFYEPYERQRAADVAAENERAARRSGRPGEN